MVYSLYNFITGECLLRDVTSREIAEYTGMRVNSVTRYARERRLYKGKYSIQAAKKKTAEEKFIAEWNRVTEPFKNVKWVKAGGKKLKI